MPLTAPYQKKQAKGKIPCKNFSVGRCNKPNCQFLHEKRPMNNTVSTDVLGTMLSLIFEKNNDVIWVKEKSLVNLRNLKQCPDLEKVQSAIDFNTVSFCNALCQSIREKIVTPEYLVLDENDIKTGFHLFKALEANNLHVTLKGLCVSNNQIHTFEALKVLKNFHHLTEVKFDGNPIAEEPDYYSKLRKMLPTILGIDGRGVDRDPLALPWPLQSHHGETELGILQQLEADLFQKLGSARPGTSGVENVVGCYSSQAVFTFCIEEDSEFQTPTNYPKAKKDIPKDFVAMRLAQQALNRNMMKGVRTNRSKIGVLEVCNALKECVYPPRFQVMHTLDSNANVSILQEGDGVKEQVALISVHGEMAWKHLDQLDSDEPTYRLFDRTFVLTCRPGQGISITNDSLYLRRVTTQREAILTPYCPSRVQGLARRYQVPLEVVQAVVEKVAKDGPPSPEAEMHHALNAIRRIDGDLWQNCVNVCDSDVDSAITVARAVEHYRLNPQAAHHALLQASGNLADIATILQNYDQDQFVVIV